VETSGPGGLLALPLVMGFFAGVWWLNWCAARWLDGQLQQVAALTPAEDER
jgi:dipeptide/tripeptide permease